MPVGPRRRQTELVPEVKRRLPDDVRFNSHDVLSVRRAHNIDEQTRPEFIHRPRFGWYQYSNAFVQWLIEQYERDTEFFAKARTRYYELTH